MFIPQARFDPSAPKPISVPYTNSGSTDLLGGAVLVSNGKVVVVIGSGIRKLNSPSGPNTGSVAIGFGWFDWLCDASTFTTPYTAVYWNATGTPVDQAASPISALANTGCLTTNPAGATFVGFTNPEQPSPAILGDGARARAWLGEYTYTVGPVQTPVTAVTAAGSTVSDAAALAAGFNLVTGADGTKGVVLPTAPAVGTIVRVKNSSVSALKLYPDAAATINAIGSHANISMAAQTSADFTATSATQWYTTPLVPS